MQKIHAPVILLAITCLSCSGFGQTTSYMTSPRGYLSTEGNTHFYLTSGAAVNRRYMSIDDTVSGTVRAFKEFALRRDSTHTALSNVAASQFKVSLNMGVGIFQRLHQIFDDNYVGAKTSVFSRKTVNFPDWRTRVTAPAPFDFSLTLNSVFVYTGQSAFIWEMAIEGAATGNRITDRQYTGRANAASAPLGTGCVATGQNYGFQHNNNLQNSGSAYGKYGMRIIANGTWAPKGGDVFMSVAPIDANLSIPGWCDKLRAVPLVLLPLGKADPLGKIRNQYWSFPFNASVVNQMIVTQLFAPDRNAPNGFVLSNGAQNTMPSTTSTGTVHAAYIWSTLNSTPSRGAVNIGGSYIARLGY